jgi:hypothetical protein
VFYYCLAGCGRLTSIGLSRISCIEALSIARFDALR